MTDDEYLRLVEQIKLLKKYLINAQKIIQDLYPKPITFPEIRKSIEKYGEKE